MGTRRSTDTRKREIAEAALKIIAEHGLGRFTTHAVARAVGVSDGAIFRHFPSKEAIVVGAIDRVEEILFGNTNEDPLPSDPLDRLGVFVRRRVSVVRGNPAITRIVFSNALAQAAGPAGARRVEGFKVRTLHLMRECLEEASGLDLLVPDVPIGHLLIVVQGTLLGLVFRGDVQPGDPQSPEAVWSSLEKLIRKEGP